MHPIVKEIIIIFRNTECGNWLLALSGGADSTALFRGMQEAGISFEAAHCNFNLRGEESLRDRHFVTELCRQFDVKLHIADFDTRNMALKGESIEMTCRRLRYDFFNQLLKKHCFGRIAVAHNADDNIETFFLNALRGSSSKGLKGMDFETGTIVRPLLKFSRAEILQFLQSIDQPFITDSTNLESDYRRNFLRNEVFPLLKRRWPGFEKGLTTTIELQRRDNSIIEHYLSDTLAGITTLLPWNNILSFPDPQTLIFRFINPFGGTREISQEIVRAMSDTHKGKKWLLKDVFLAITTREGLKIERCAEYLPDFPRLACWEPLKMEDIGFDRIKKASNEEIFLPFGKEAYEWKTADRQMTIAPLGMKGNQIVWKVLKDAGVTSNSRQRFPVLICRKSGEVIWLPGIKRSRWHLLSPEHSSLFRLSLKRTLLP